MVKVAPTPGVALDAHAAAMPVEHMFDQSKTKAGAALGAAVGNVDPVKALGQPRQMFGRNARPVVANRQLRFRAFRRASGRGLA